MRDRIIHFLSVLGVCAVWIVFIVFVTGFISCNSSKHLQRSTANSDTVALKKKDSTALSVSHTEESNENESIWDMLFSLKESVDAQGKTVQSPYLSSLKVTERNKSGKVADKKDSVHVETTDSTYIKLYMQLLEKQNSTKVFPDWQIWAIAIACLVTGFITRYFKIQRR